MTGEGMEARDLNRQKALTAEKAKWKTIYELERVKQRQGWDKVIVRDEFARRHGEAPTEAQLLEELRRFNHRFLEAVAKELGLLP